MGFMFEDLEVYKRAVALAERITRLTGEFSSGSYAIADQIRRASVSISCNIAEGNGRWHVKERRQFFMIARGSLFECVPLLEITRNLSLMGESEYSELRSELEEISRMLAGLIKGVEKRKALGGN